MAPPHGVDVPLLLNDAEASWWFTGMDARPVADAFCCAIVALALAGLFVANAVNPEAIVARRNLSGPTRAGETDLVYLLQLSPDSSR